MPNRFLTSKEVHAISKELDLKQMPDYLQAWLEKLPPKQLAAIYDWLKENPDAAEQMIEVLSESQE